IDIPAEIGLARARRRSGEMPDRMEQENIEFYRKVRDGYLILAKTLPGRYIVVDGTKSVAEVEENIWTELKKHVV
ncbi:MAG TPA: dTMP kinase, partial [Opitutales bacterium]|nr:dTMP kinase [Opitutales bacterium]